MTQPTVTVRVDWDADGAFAQAIDDVSSRVISEGLSWTRGRSADFSAEATGQAQFTLRNDDDRFTPDRNWHDNPSFEAGTTGWSVAAIASLTAAATSITQVTDNATSATGTKAGEAVLTGTVNSGVTYAIPYRFRSGVTYAVSVYLKSISGNLNVRAGLASSGTPADIASSGSNITASWAAYTFTWTPSADRADGVFFVRTTTAAAATLRIDGVQVNPGGTANTYLEAPTKGQLVPGKPVHIMGTYSATDYGCFYGYIERLAPDPREKTVVVTCYDVLRRLSETDIVVAPNAFIQRCARDLRVAVLEDAERGTLNLLANPEFASDTTGWGGSPTRYTTDGPLTISTCAEIAAAGTSNSSSYLAPVFFAGQYYRGSVYLRSPGSPTTVELSMTTVSTTVTITVTPPSTWTRYTVAMPMPTTKTASGSGTATNPTLQIANTGANAVRFSAAAMTRGKALYPYSATGTGRWPNWCGNGSFDGGARNGWIDGWTNLCGNPSFETNTSGWSATGDAFTTAATSLARDTGYHDKGVASGKVITGGAGKGIYYAVTGTFKSGVTYRLRVSGCEPAASGNAMTAGIGSQGTPADKAEVTTAGYLGASFQAITTTWTPSSDRTDAHIYVKSSGSITMYVDSIFLARRDPSKTTDPTYCDTGLGSGGSFTTSRTIETTTAKYGGNSLSITTPATATAGQVYDFYHYGSYFMSGRAYTLSLWVYPSSSMPYKVGMGADKLDGTWDESTATTGTATANTWTQITNTWTPTADRSSANEFNVLAYLYQTDATARTVFIDGVRVIPGNAADSFEMAQWTLAAGAEVSDGYTTAAELSGTAGAALASINDATLSRHWITAKTATPWYGYTTSDRTGLASKSSVETFDDDIADMAAAEIDRAQLVNIVYVGGYYYSDETSVNAFGPRPGASVNWAYYGTTVPPLVGAAVLARYAQPRARPTITVVNRFPSQLARELDDLVTVNFARLGIVAGKYLIAAITTTISQNGNWWETVYTLEESPY